MKLKQNQQGFTLLELLVVVAVMAVIAGAAMMSMSGQEEHAGQGVAMHTMQTLENASREFGIINKKTPDNFESMLCTGVATTVALQTTNGMTVSKGVDEAGTAVAVSTNTHNADHQDNLVINTVAGDGDGSGITATNAQIFGGFSDAGLIGGGLTKAFSSKILAVDLPIAGVEVLTNSGITHLQFADANGCDDLDSTESISTAAAKDLALDEYPLVNSAFDAPGNGGGFGISVTLDPAASAPIMLYEEPQAIGASDNDIIVVLGIGNSSELVTDGKFIAKAPRDGNVSGDKYGHFSVALKVGEYGENTADKFNLAQVDTVAGDGLGVVWLDEPKLVAVLDADGDYYEGEIAEFAGLEDE
jgi:prepilin-type N-terminal cleavage/methylation domain-containing protein